MDRQAEKLIQCGLGNLEATWLVGQSNHLLIPIQSYFVKLSFLLQFWIDGSQLINFAISDFSKIQFFTNLFQDVTFLIGREPSAVPDILVA